MGGYRLRTRRRLRQPVRGRRKGRFNNNNKSLPPQQTGKGCGGDTAGSRKKGQRGLRGYGAEAVGSAKNKSGRRRLEEKNKSMQG